MGSGLKPSSSRENSIQEGSQTRLRPDLARISDQSSGSPQSPMPTSKMGAPAMHLWIAVFNPIHGAQFYHVL